MTRSTKCHNFDIVKSEDAILRRLHQLWSDVKECVLPVVTTRRSWGLDHDACLHSLSKELRTFTESSVEIKMSPPPRPQLKFTKVLSSFHRPLCSSKFSGSGGCWGRCCGGRLRLGFQNGRVGWEGSPLPVES